jgi:hypothetical protein
MEVARKRGRRTLDVGTSVNEQEFSSAGNADQSLESMEQRLHRLEAALASMQDMRALEERVAEKVRQRVQSTADERMIDSKRQALSGSNAALHKEPAALAYAPAAVRRTWLLLDMWADLVSIIRMFFDVRYRSGHSHLATVAADGGHTSRGSGA